MNLDGSTTVQRHDQYTPAAHHRWANHKRYQPDIQARASSSSQGPTELRRPLDIRVQVQLSKLRQQVITHQTALYELEQYRNHIPDAEYHSQVHENECELAKTTGMINRLTKLAAYARDSETPEPQLVMSPPPPISPASSDGHWAHQQSPIGPHNVIDEFVNMSTWLTTKKQDFIQNRVPNLPQVVIPEEAQGAYYFTLANVYQQVQDLEGKLPMLYLLFKEIDNVRGLAIISVLVQQQCILLQSSPPKFIVSQRYLQVIVREVEKALGRYHATLQSLKLSFHSPSI